MFLGRASAATSVPSATSSLARSRRRTRSWPPAWSASASTTSDASGRPSSSARRARSAPWRSVSPGPVQVTPSFNSWPSGRVSCRRALVAGPGREAPPCPGPRPVARGWEWGGPTAAPGVSPPSRPSCRPTERTNELILVHCPRVHVPLYPVYVYVSPCTSYITRLVFNT